MFCTFDFDYLSIRTHASGQLAYNPIERNIATLSQKLAGIILLINKHGFYLNSQNQMVDLELAIKNMYYTGKALYAF